MAIKSTRVYTTDPEPAAAATPVEYPSAATQTARVALDRRRRRGKTVTVISGLRHDPATFEALLRRLKQQCGAGGTVKDGELEIQGDHREKVLATLQAAGYKVKSVGG